MTTNDIKSYPAEEQRTLSNFLSRYIMSTKDVSIEIRIKNHRVNNKPQTMISLHSWYDAEDVITAIHSRLEYTRNTEIRLRALRRLLEDLTSGAFE